MATSKVPSEAAPHSAPHSEATGPPWSRAIDVHHHIIPEFYAAELRELGFASTLPGVDKPAWRVGSSLAMMDRQGIRAAVVNVWPGVPPVDAATGAKFARRVNEYLAGLVAEHPGRLGAFAVLPLPHVDAALEELAYSTDVLGLDGVGLVTHYGGVYVGDPALDAFHAEAARRGTPLFVHPTTPPVDQPTFGLPVSLCEFPFETVRLASQLLYNGTLDRHPGLRVILSHGGGGVAYYAARLACGPLIRADLAERLPADPLAYLGRLYSDTAMIGEPHAFASVRSFTGADRLLVGSDFPFMPESYSTAGGRFVVDHGGFSAGDLDRVEFRNALDLFPRFADDQQEGR
ncbi:amidohydrolase family protein [Streptomyces spectabilis]|uniref:Amidohydrolase n=1 Tax=Streptomyces spectabilis TaxID=68270 RepID=A0A5P2XFZ0_STRST|nr:amidohydrolase family protein [Streptomyces spectabilis]MBB5104526.1 putative TIM-barrel fold metal-dependent hydrolase [Streptomyces spectabilis]MCI3905119.1 amidohydrolase [Streptomyces spectabilis]QEV62135.1 amidohydrolase [Streptomyces spectabilis]GGV00520.1 amidohydrolase [Streptomyces spectabilis]